MISVFLLAAVVSWPSIVERMERAASVSDLATLRTASAEAEQLADATEGVDQRQHLLALYGAAYAQWRCAFLPGMTDNETSDALEHAERNLRRAIKVDAKFAEVHALLGAVLGSKIRAGGNAMALGPEAAQVMDAAARLQPDNPRVLVLEASNAFHTPAEYGGGADRAEASLRRALAAFDREPAARPWPNWGRFDAHVWLGQVLAAKHDKAGARTEYDKALAIWPESGYVKYKLIPMLNK
jgi:tetratricopeptide (TPR) repeat protein